MVAFTLGPGVDTLIKRYELTELSLVPVLQACAAVYTEEQADKAQSGLEQYAKERGTVPSAPIQSWIWRFSPVLPALFI